MEIFEFHFNPKFKRDYFFDSFIYEPENAYEKKLGSLYLIGDIKNALPSNSKLLDNLSQVIKNNYYNLSFKYPSKGLSQSLKKTNEFLSEEVKKENVSWLGNLNFAALSIKDSAQNSFTRKFNTGYDLTFTKTGDLKILLIREGQIIDIGKNLNLEEIDPYPLKIFFNVVSGKLVENDFILTLTKDVFDFFIQENLLNKISDIQDINQKNLKKILPSNLFTDGQGSKVSGICFLILLKNKKIDKNEHPLKQKTNGHTKETISPEKEKFSLSKIFLPIIKPIENIKKLRLLTIKNPLKLLSGQPALLRQPTLLRKALLAGKALLTGKMLRTEKPTQNSLINNIGINKEKKVEAPHFSPLIGNQLKKLNFTFKKSRLKTNLVIIIILISILFLGFSIFKGAQKEKEKQVQISLEEIQEKFETAERFLIFKETEKANTLFMEVWEEISLLNEKENSNLIDLKKSVKKNLERINNLEKIENPEIIIELNSEIGLTPQNILLKNSDLYFYSPSSSRIYKFNFQKNKGIILETNKNLEFGDIFSDAILFFSKPNNLIYLKDDIWKEETIDTKEFNFISFSSYMSNLYLLDKNNNEIIKYPYIDNFKWNSAQNWIKNKPNEIKQTKSIAINESVWVLNTDNSIDKYYTGNYQKTINFNLFPLVENITEIKVKTNIPYLYILESKNKRIIITDKNGKVFKQFQSEKFNNLKDITISNDGKTIYILNDWMVYKIRI
ncbi:MAG: hypothetical protein ABH956_03645 [Candidatus Nealsonbacteria bacterium]